MVLGQLWRSRAPTKGPGGSSGESLGVPACPLHETSHQAGISEPHEGRAFLFEWGAPFISVHPERPAELLSASRQRTSGLTQIKPLLIVAGMGNSEDKGYFPYLISSYFSWGC